MPEALNVVSDFMPEAFSQGTHSGTHALDTDIRSKKTSFSPPILS